MEKVGAFSNVEMWGERMCPVNMEKENNFPDPIF